MHNLTELQDLSMQNNKIAQIEGLTSLTKLRRLNLSFNKLTKIEGISTLQMLEFLELGKNQINQIDALQSPNNRLVFLTELYLYMNKLKQFPKNASFPILKVLNLNKNPDLKSLDLGYCPLLESLTASQCSISDINSFKGCQSLKELDLAFN